ncbi:ATP-binding cassette domain-containing protein [bacterium]|nr:ATP-binding cassette domain-containing protein [bacterium]
MLKFNSLVIGYTPQKPLYDAISLEIKKGDFWGVVGANGAGKTTLLQTILEIIPPISGKIERESKNLKIGYVPQYQNITKEFPITVQEVIEMGCYNKNSWGIFSKKGIKKLVQEKLKEFSIEHLAKKDFSKISGGERQRAFLARAMLNSPDILILDEPSTGIDEDGKAELLNILKNLHKLNNLTVMMISHDKTEVDFLATHKLIFNKKERKISIL